MSGPAVEVVLVDFVGEENKGVFLAETDEFLLGAFFQESTCGVTGVDDDQRPSVDAVLLGFLDGEFDFVQRGRPAIDFGEVVWEGDTGVLGKCGSVEGVLGDGNEHAGFVGGDEHVEEERDSRRCTRGEEDVFGICGVTITFWKVKKFVG